LRELAAALPPVRASPKSVTLSAPVFIHQQIPRLDVAMDNLCRVGNHERVDQLAWRSRA